MGEIKFEQALEKLEDIVNRLEDGSVPLDVSLAKYEEGVKLVRLCQKKLGEAKKKIEILIKTKDGKFKLEPFEEREIEKKRK
ncbi:MAG: exodeoxyribonuclease VII small subunit [Omnitrophica bacterium]|nr:exodeoxyribonuclease VII small subunit [Candidatus Omnitrophota bacterium]